MELQAVTEYWRLVTANAALLRQYRKHMPHYAPVAAFVLVTGLVLPGCGGGGRPAVSAPSSIGAATERQPAGDLSAAVVGTGRNANSTDPGHPGPASSERRVGTGAPHDLEEIRLIARRDGSIDAVAPTMLLDSAKAQLDAGHPMEAIKLYHQLATEFPTSKLAPSALFNVGIVYENLGDISRAIAAYRELATRIPDGRVSLDAHLRVAGLEAERSDWPAAERTLRDIEVRDDLSFSDRIETGARLGYVLLEQGNAISAKQALDGALASWKRTVRPEDPYFIAMAHYYLGELAHREFLGFPLHSADELLKRDLAAKEQLAAVAYDQWKKALEYKDSYWALAAGYRMSQVFMELWETAARAPYPDGLTPDARAYYAREVHDRVRRHLHTALDGHQMNVKLASAYGVDNDWSRASAAKAGEITAILAREARGEVVVPTPPTPVPSLSTAQRSSAN